MTMTRRNLLAGAGAAAASTLLSRAASAQSFPFTPNQRYPDPAVQILDPGFAKYRIYSSTVEQVATGMRWAEGPAYFPEGGYLLFSDIPNNRIMKFDEKTNQTSVFRANANYANGNARDRQGRLVTCEHSVTRRITRTEKDGKITVLADKFEGKRLNAPNDIVVKSDDTIWFTDPLFGINGEWEGKKEKPEQATTNVYRLTKDGKLTAVITDIVNPNGLAFSPDEKKLYVVEWKGTPNRSIWSFDVNADGTLGGKTKVIDAADQGAHRRLQGRSRRQSVVRLGLQRRAASRADRRRWPQGVPAQGQVGGSRRRHGVQPRRQAARPHPPAGTLRQSHLRRAEEQPPLYDELPLGLRAVCGVAWGGLDNNHRHSGAHVVRTRNLEIRVWSFGPSRNDEQLG